MNSTQPLEKEARLPQDQPDAKATDFTYTYSAKQNREI